MIAVITKITRKKSRYGGYFFYIFFRSIDGKKTFYSCIYEKMRNFSRWKHVMDIGTTLTNLKIVKGKPKLVNADSKFEIVEEK